MASTWARGIRPKVTGVDVGAEAPGRAKLRTIGEQDEDARRRDVVDEQGEELQRGGIDPVQVFDDEQHRLIRGVRQDDRAKSLEGLLALPLRAHQGSWVALGQRQ